MELKKLIQIYKTLCELKKNLLILFESIIGLIKIYTTLNFTHTQRFCDLK